jgi:hypothetical protein
MRAQDAQHIGVCGASGVSEADITADC